LQNPKIADNFSFHALPGVPDFEGTQRSNLHGHIVYTIHTVSLPSVGPDRGSPAVASNPVVPLDGRLDELPAMPDVIAAVPAASWDWLAESTALPMLSPVTTVLKFPKHTLDWIAACYAFDLSNATLSNVEGDGSASPPHDNVVPSEGDQSLNYGNMSLRELRWHARRLHGPDFYDLLDTRGCSLHCGQYQVWEAGRE
jgi:hypothetical protein